MSLTVFEVLSYQSWLHSSLTNTRGVTRRRYKSGFIFLHTTQLARNMCDYKKNPKQTNKKNPPENIFLTIFTISLPIPWHIFEIFEGRKMLLHCIPYRKPQLKIKLRASSSRLRCYCIYEVGKC